jgi:hypothetical protein
MKRYKFEGDYKTIESMGMELTLEIMVNNSKVSRLMENNMVRAFTQKMNLIDMVYEKMAKDLSCLNIKSY